MASRTAVKIQWHISVSNPSQNDIYSFFQSYSLHRLAVIPSRCACLLSTGEVSTLLPFSDWPSPAFLFPLSPPSFLSLRFPSSDEKEGFFLSLPLRLLHRPRVFVVVSLSPAGSSLGSWRGYSFLSWCLVFVLPFLLRLMSK